MSTQICPQAELSSGRIRENLVRRYDTFPSRVELGRETYATKTGTHARAGQSERLSDLPPGRRCRRHRHSLFGRQSWNLPFSSPFLNDLCSPLIQTLIGSTALQSDAKP